MNCLFFFFFIPIDQIFEIDSEKGIETKINQKEIQMRSILYATNRRGAALEMQVCIFLQLSLSRRAVFRSISCERLKVQIHRTLP